MNKEIKLKTRTYYSSITSLDYKPKEICKIRYKLVYRKGDVIPPKISLFSKKETKYAETDLYERIWYDFDGHSSKSLISAEGYAKANGLRYESETNEVYAPAKVTIGFDNNKHIEEYRFDDDNEALEFIEEIKIKCKKCNNELL